MTLIARLGGYSAVKNAARNYRISGDILTAEKFEREALQYRREHGVFEHLDLVVYESGSSKLLVVSKRPKNKGFTVRPKDENCFDFYPRAKIRHATDAEIEAGHRLAEDVIEEIKNGVRA